MSFLKELFQFIVARKKYWLVPIIVIHVILGALFIIAQGSAVSPFIYTLF